MDKSPKIPYHRKLDVLLTQFAFSTRTFPTLALRPLHRRINEPAVLNGDERKENREAERQVACERETKRVAALFRVVELLRSLDVQVYRNQSRIRSCFLSKGVLVLYSL